jgi:hypothetical protein
VVELQRPGKMAAMVCAGLSAVSAIWKTIWMRRNCSRLRSQMGRQRLAVEEDLAKRGRHQSGDRAREAWSCPTPTPDHAQRLTAMQRGSTSQAPVTRAIRASGLP